MDTCAGTRIQPFAKEDVKDVKKVTILLADDDRDLLESLQKLLQSEFNVVACVNDGYKLIEAAKLLAPDLIVTDISMEGLSGIRAARQLKSEQPNARIIFLTVHDESAFVAEARKVGALGYVIKRSADCDLIPAIREALQGRSFVSSAARQ
jgi:DNA-binding NarL/FixJ family response regulator